MYTFEQFRKGYGMDQKEFFFKSTDTAQTILENLKAK